MSGSGGSWKGAAEQKERYRRSGNFRCYNIFVNVRAYENLTHEYFLTTNY